MNAFNSVMLNSMHQIMLNNMLQQQQQKLRPTRPCSPCQSSFYSEATNDSGIYDASFVSPYAGKAINYFTSNGTPSVLSVDRESSSPFTAFSQSASSTQSVGDASEICDTSAKRSRRSRDKCRYCRKYKPTKETFEEHMLKCPNRPDLANRHCKHCGGKIADNQSFADHNLTCTKNKLRAKCVVCHENKAKVELNADSRCFRCEDIMDRLSKRLPRRDTAPPRKYGIVKKSH